jgi:hypothetical protein
VEYANSFGLRSTIYVSYGKRILHFYMPRRPAGRDSGGDPVMTARFVVPIGPIGRAEAAVTAANRGSARFASRSENACPGSKPLSVRLADSGRTRPPQTGHSVRYQFDWRPARSSLQRTISLSRHDLTRLWPSSTKPGPAALPLADRLVHQGELC